MLGLRAVAAAAFVVTVATACNSSSGGGDEEATETVPSSAPGSGACVQHSGTTPRDNPEGDSDVFLLDVRVARLDACADEVVFEFRSSGREFPPGYQIAYEPGPFLDFTSGDEVTPAGAAFLVVRFPRTGIVEVVDAGGEPDFDETFDLGRESITPSDLNHLEEARLVQGPERTVQWVIGLDSERPFSVDASTLPVPLPPDTPLTVPETFPPPIDPSTTTSSTTTTTLPRPATSRVVVRIG
jgi:hypothetical protein